MKIQRLLAASAAAVLALSPISAQAAAPAAAALSVAQTMQAVDSNAEDDGASLGLKVGIGFILFVALVAGFALTDEDETAVSG